MTSTVVSSDQLQLKPKPDDSTGGGHTSTKQYHGNMDDIDLIALEAAGFISEDDDDVIDTKICRPFLLPTPPSSTPCRHWLRLGRCNFGETCRFTHVDASPLPLSTTAAATTASGRLPASAIYRPVFVPSAFASIPCKYGIHCYAIRTCPYAHPTASDKKCTMDPHCRTQTCVYTHPLRDSSRQCVMDATVLVVETGPQRGLLRCPSFASGAAVNFLFRDVINLQTMHARFWPTLVAEKLQAQMAPPTRYPDGSWHTAAVRLIYPTCALVDEKTATREYKSPSILPPESDRAEYKSLENTNQPDTTFAQYATKYASAFLNSRDGGVLLGGVHDSGCVLGVQLTRRQRDVLALAVDQKIRRMRPKPPTQHMYSVQFIPVVSGVDGQPLEDTVVVQLNIKGHGGEKLAQPYEDESGHAWKRTDGRCVKYQLPTTTEASPPKK